MEPVMEDDPSLKAALTVISGKAAFVVEGR
jgi:hypothetical protein